MLSIFPLLCYNIGLWLAYQNETLLPTLSIVLVDIAPSKCMSTLCLSPNTERLFFKKSTLILWKIFLKKYVLTLNQPLWSSTVNMTMFIFLSISLRKSLLPNLSILWREYLPESSSISIQIFFLLSSTLLFGLLVTLLLLAVALLSPSLLSTSKISALLLFDFHQKFTRLGLISPTWSEGDLRPVC